MVMISMPMTEKGWRKKYDKIENRLKEKGYQVAPLYMRDIFDREPQLKYQVNVVPLLYMGNSFYRMCMCDTVCFCDGWEKARGCQLEYKAATMYRLNIMYEKDIQGEQLCGTDGTTSKEMHV